METFVSGKSDARAPNLMVTADCLKDPSLKHEKAYVPSDNDVLGCGVSGKTWSPSFEDATSANELECSHFRRNDPNEPS